MNRLSRKTICLFIAGVAMSASSAFAANYGMAGCGIGALVFKDEPGKIQIVAATLNDYISPQTSAITSGTSNCYEDDAHAQAELYVTINEQALQNDIARGNGEALDGLSKILQCDDSQSLGSSLQKNYKSIFPTSNVSGIEAAKSIETSIQGDSALAHTCKLFS